MTKHLVFISITISLLLSGACTHYYYAPNSAQAPFLQEQHDTRLELGTIAGDEFSGWEAQAMYSPVKYGAMMVNYFSVSSNRNADPADDWGRGRLVEIALGGYYPFSEYAVISLMGGWGAGSAYNSFDINSAADLHFQKRFLQPGIAFQIKWARIGTTFRFNQLEYVRGNIDYGIGEPHLTDIQHIEQESPIYIPEACFTFGFGYRPFWGNIHLNYSNLDQRRDLQFARFTFGTSFMIEIDQLWRKKTEAR